MSIINIAYPTSGVITPQSDELFDKEKADYEKEHRKLDLDERKHILWVRKTFVPRTCFYAGSRVNWKKKRKEVKSNGG